MLTLALLVINPVLVLTLIATHGREGSDSDTRMRGTGMFLNELC